MISTTNSSSEVPLYKTLAPLSATRALLIHSTHVDGIKKQVILSHEVNNGVIGVGRIINPSAVKRVVAGKVNQNTSKTKSLKDGFIDANVLAENEDSIAFYAGSKERTLWFSVTGNESYQIKCPSLLFIFKKKSRSLNVVMFLGKKRPTLDTMMYLVPFMNISNCGSVCTGTMPLPKQWMPDSALKIEKSFFNSRFTHTNYSFPQYGVYGNSSENLQYIRRLSESNSVMKKKDLIQFKTLGQMLSENH